MDRRSDEVKCSGSTSHVAGRSACLAFLFLFSVSGCSEPSEGGDHFGLTRQQLIHGTEDEAPYRYPFVAYVADEDSNCTATMVSCGAAISAAHCRLPGGGIFMEKSTFGLSSDVTRFGSPIKHPDYLPPYFSASSDVAILPLRHEGLHKGTIESRLAFQAGLRTVRYATVATALDRPIVKHPNTLSAVVVGAGSASRYKTTFGPAYLTRLVDSSGTAVYQAEIPSETSTRITPGDSGGGLFLSAVEDKLIGVASTVLLPILKPGDEWWERALYADLTAANTSSWLSTTLAALDVDGNGVPDNCEICPGGPDDDDDGIPNSCDLCPCDGSEANPREDGDRDGICGRCDAGLSDFCGAVCASATVDNCPENSNNNQGNANLEAELARNATILGDVCDPVPSPQPEPVYSESVSREQFGPLHLIRTDFALSNFHIRKAFVDFDANDFDVPAADYRFCNAVSVGDCSARNLIDDAWLMQRPSWQEEKLSDPWRRIRTEATASDLDASDTAKDATIYSWHCDSGLGCLHSPYTRTWDYGADANRFASPPSGRFWAHTYSTLGQTTPHPTLGLHLRTDGGQADSLSNSYADTSTTDTRTSYYVEGQQLNPHIIVRDCPMCVAFAERPYDWRTQEAIVLGRVLVPELQPLGFVTSAGGMQPVSEVVASAATERLASSSSTLVWANAIHPNQAAGMASWMPVAVALADGTQVTDVLWRDDGALVGLGDIAGNEELSKRLQLLGIDSSLPLVSGEAAASSGMELRADYKVVYDAVGGVIFVVGGQNDGKPVGDIWSYRFLARTWSRIPLGSYAPRTVEAATRSGVDGKLWVVDYDHGTQARRVTVIDPDTGIAEDVLVIEGSDPDKIWLGLDYSGGILATCSKSETWIFGLSSAEGSLEVTGTAHADEPLLIEPIVDARGIKLLGLREGEGALTVSRVPSLEQGGSVEDFVVRCMY